MDLLPTVVLLALVGIGGGPLCCRAQSNYADQANNVEYQGGPGLPEQATLDGKVTKLDELSPVIFLNRTKAVLNCAAGSMQVELKFNDRFYGVAYADFARNSACQVFGKGDYSYKLELPLKGCGTKQDPQRVFTNNIVVRFHPNLEIDGDEIITVVCRYPPPVAPTPVVAPFPRQAEPAPALLEPPLKGFHILLIICGILFLSLLLLGLGCSYYCLSRKRAPIIRKQPFSTIGTESEITKLSGSSLVSITMFEGLKIPRVHAPPPVGGSSSESEGPLVSDTLPSDYPSESHSEADEVDNRSLPVSSAGSFENKAFVQETVSVFSEGYGQTHEQHMQNTMAASQTRSPKFDVQVKSRPPAPYFDRHSGSETDSSSFGRINDRNLSTIMEQREESIRSSVDSQHQFAYAPELHAPPKYAQTAPTYNRILRKQLYEPTSHSFNRSVSEMTEELHESSPSHIFSAPHSTPIAPHNALHRSHYVTNLGQTEAIMEPANTTIQHAEDAYLRTLTEHMTVEEYERYMRSIKTEYQTRPKAPTPSDPHWNVTIKNYPVEIPEPEWENFSDVSSTSGMPTPKMQRAPLTLPPQKIIADNKLPLNSPELVGSISQQDNFIETFNIPIHNPEVPNWNVLIRVLHATDDGPVIETADAFNSQLTISDKMKWKQIISQRSTLRSLLTEAVVREDYERIRNDSRYTTLFDPPKWDVIIRILSPPAEKNGKSRSKKMKPELDGRSRRSSLPTLYEYDSDGGSSVRTIRQETQKQTPPPQIPRSGTSYRSDADLRSMSEVTVEFGRVAPPHSDITTTTTTTAAGYYHHPPSHATQSHQNNTSQYYYEAESHHGGSSLARSLSQPSLARSASEITERWALPSRYMMDTTSDFAVSPETTPRPQRRGTTMGETVVTRQQYMRSSEASSSSTRYEMDASGGRKKNSWFADNESETSSYK